MENENWKKLEFTFKLSGEESQNLLNALSQLPYKISAHFIQLIQQQTVPQYMKYEQASRQNENKEST